MKHKKTITSIAFLLLGLGGLHAQESPTATGAEATGTGGTASYSIGQVVYTTNKSKNKVEYLEQFLDDFELLKLEIRLCTDMKVLSIKKQAQLSFLMDGIGKEITGWRNANE